MGAMLTENFSLAEMTRSQAATRLRIKNEATPEIAARLAKLAQKVLQPVRDHFGPVNVSSGYRCPALNKAIGGSRTSQHMTGAAADIEVYGIANIELARWIEKHLEFDQLILEYPDSAGGGWVHVSYVEGRNRRQAMTMKRGGMLTGLQP